MGQVCFVLEDVQDQTMAPSPILETGLGLLPALVPGNLFLDQEDSVGEGEEGVDPARANI